jgi:hypothetical protein
MGTAASSSSDTAWLRECLQRTLKVWWHLPLRLNPVRSSYAPHVYYYTVYVWRQPQSSGAPLSRGGVSAYLAGHLYRPSVRAGEPRASRLLQTQVCPSARIQ